jgi:hypothetical protein
LAFSNDGFDKAVALPPGLTITHLRNAIEFVEEKAEELIDLYRRNALRRVAANVSTPPEVRDRRC